MVDAHALGACGLGRAGSNPASPTRFSDEKRTFASTQSEFRSEKIFVAKRQSARFQG